LAKITHLFLSDEQIRRAAEEMLDKHGEGCLGIVTEQIGILRSLPTIGSWFTTRSRA
jgi:hypothetical protein